MTAAKTHISLNVTNVETSAAWYQAFFDTVPHKKRAGYANFDLEQPPLKLALSEQNSADGGPLNHLGILLNSRDEVLAHRARLESAGMAFLSEDQERCCHAIQTKVWAKDPDGNMWEIYTIDDDMLEEEEAHEASTSCSVDAGCC